MAKRGDPRLLRLVVVWLRSIPKWTQAKFAEAAGVRQSDVSRYEQGIEAPSEEVLRRMARAVAVPWSVVVQVRRAFMAALLVVDGQRRGDSSVVGEEFGRIWGEIIALALTPYQIDEGVREVLVDPEILRRDAAEIWRALSPLPAARRLVLLGAYPWDGRRWEALIEQICAASRQETANDPHQATEIAEFALAVAKQGGFEDGRRALIEAYIWGFIANARRVANELEAAEQAFFKVRRLRQAGEGHAPELLDVNRLLDLEASLRCDQQRYPEALALLKEARAAASGDSAVGRILLIKEHVFERMGDHAAALAVLEEARPFIENSGEPRLLFALHFNTADNLHHLGRDEEASEFLPPVREHAAGNLLDLVRVRWLEARVAAGQGTEEDAVASLEEVQRIFTAERLPYDAALTSLDLAVLFLRKGRTGEVQRLAAEMAWIFAVNGIRREGAAALTLFCEAAKRETATVELVRRVIREVERSR